MNQEIENLINMALADGEVTEKERAIILRKAESLGLDKDEVEMILDGKIALYKKGQSMSQSTFHQRSNKEGDLRKCPSCGAPAPSFNTKCSDCGHEFRNTEASTYVNQFFKQIQEIESIERGKPVEKEKSLNSLFVGNYFADLENEKRIATRIANSISTFPVPNTKEDILEFLSLALPQANIKVRKVFFQTVNEDIPKETMKKAWKSKCEQIIMKARFSMKDDKNTLEEIEYYAKQIGIK